MSSSSAGPVTVMAIVPRFGTVHRGVEVFARELACRLDRRRFRFSVLSAPHDQQLDGVLFLERPTVLRERSARLFSTRVSRSALRAVGIPGPAELESFVLMAAGLRDVWRARYDAVLPLGGHWSYLYAQLHRRRGAKVVSVGQAGPTGTDLRLSDVFVGLTPTAIEEAQRLRPELPCVLIPNGVDTSVFKPPLARMSASPVILAVGALVRDKRHDLLFDAVTLLPPSVTLRCVGDGPEGDALSQHALCKAGRVSFESVGHGAMSARYQDADVFSLASPEEAFGIVFLEALASGLNVVAHDAPRQRFVVGESGFFCDVRDPKNYAAALQSAIDDRRTERNRAHASRFEWSLLVRKYEQLFEELSRAG